MKKKVISILITSFILLIIAVILALYLSRGFCCFDPCSGSPGYDSALSANDELKCLLIVTEGANSYSQDYDTLCREKCLNQVAFNKKNISICSSINNVKNESALKGPSEKDNCYIGFAKNLSNSSICALSETAWALEFCPKIVDLQN